MKRLGFLPLMIVVMFLSCEQPRTAGAKPPGRSGGEVSAAEPAEPGAIEGVVRLEGPAPLLPKLKLSLTVERECGKELPDRSLVVAAGGALEGVVVSVDSRPSPGGPDQVVVDQRRCAFVPVVQAARAGGVVVIRNSDPLIHNVRADAEARQLFNIGMPLEGMSTKKPLPATPSIVDLRCDVHTWMHAWVKTFDHPYFAVSGADGSFRIGGVPAGRQRLVFWHPRLGQRSAEVEVLPGKAATLDLTWPAGAPLAPM
ncbi:MAG: carboxypeptidase regulatory-like domain-containing protein [Myxococcaceae bacterium]